MFYEFEVKRTVVSHHAVLVDGVETEDEARAVLVQRLIGRVTDAELGDEQEREEEFTFTLLDTDDEDQS